MQPDRLVQQNGHNDMLLKKMAQIVIPAKAGIQRLEMMKKWTTFYRSQNAEEKGNLGIFLLRDKAVAVWTSAGAEVSILHQLCVTPSEDDPVMLPLRAARAVIRQG